MRVGQLEIEDEMSKKLTGRAETRYERMRRTKENLRDSMVEMTEGTTWKWNLRDFMAQSI